MIRKTDRPVLLDAFCGAGGATKGYQRAGFYVVGVDHKPQPRYCGDEFFQDDAMEFIERHGREFDAIHASPPCQDYSITKSIHGKKHPRMVEETRTRLMNARTPFVIENVPGSPLRNPIILCGTMFNLKVYRHRLFECSHLMMIPFNCKGHYASTGSHRGYSRDTEFICASGHNFEPKQGGRAMGIDWMIRSELAQAIPPAYSEFIGTQLMRVLTALEAR